MTKKVTDNHQKKNKENTPSALREPETQSSAEITNLQKKVGEQIDHLVEIFSENQSWHSNITDLKLEEENSTARKKTDSPDLGSLSGILQYAKNGLSKLKNIISTIQDESQLKEIEKKFQEAIQSFDKAKQEKNNYPCNNEEVQKRLLQGCKHAIKGIQSFSVMGIGATNTTEKEVLTSTDKLLKQLEIKKEETEQEEIVNSLSQELKAKREEQKKRINSLYQEFEKFDLNKTEMEELKKLLEKGEKFDPTKTRMEENKEVQKKLLQGCRCAIKDVLLSSTTLEAEYIEEASILKNIDKLLKQLDNENRCVDTEQNVSDVKGKTGDSHSTNGLQQTQAQVEEVVDIMRVNVDKVLERDQKLSELDDRADALQAGADQFEANTRKLKRKSWWENNKRALTLTTLVSGSTLGGLAAWFWYKYIETKDFPDAPSLLAVQKNLLITASVFTGLAFLAFGICLFSACAPSSCIIGGSAENIENKLGK